MTSTVSFSCSLEPSAAENPLGVEIWFDNKCIFDTPALTQPETVRFEFEETESDHQVDFVLKNKTDTHTKIDEQGNIVKDSTVLIKDIALDDIDLSNIIQNVVEYHHDFNGTAGATIEKFYGEMGCNGRAVLKFSDPVYLWLLENI